MAESEKGSVNLGQHEHALDAKDTSLAREAAEQEHSMTLVQAVRKYHTAVLWSLLLSTSIIMEGYDIVLLSSFFAQPSFSKRYGEFDAATDSYQINASWQNGLTNAVSVGTIIGAFANGYFTQKYGYRKVLLGSLALIVGFVFIPFFAPSLPVLLIGEFLCGIPVSCLCEFHEPSQSLTFDIAVGSIRNNGAGIRIRGLSNGAARLPHSVRESLLGSRPAHLGRSASRILRKR